MYRLEKYTMYIFGHSAEFVLAIGHAHARRLYLL